MWRKFTKYLIRIGWKNKTKKYKSSTGEFSLIDKMIMEGSDIKFPFLSRLLKPINNNSQSCNCFHLDPYFMCFRRPSFFKDILRVFHVDKHFENCKTYSGNLDGSMVPPSYHVQNRRYTYLLFFHIVCSIEQGGR